MEAAIFEKTGAIDLFAEAGKVKAEVTLVHAARGRFTYALYQRLIEQFPRGSLISIEGGHLLPMERPGAVAAEIRTFVAGL